jgi:hypothetical protein
MWIVLLFALAGGGCESSATGDVTAYLQAEDTIADGLEPGSGVEDIVDGWRVRFDRYVIAIGHVDLRRSSDGAEVHSHDRYAIDLARLPARGEPIASYSSIATGRWDRVSFRVGEIGAATRHPSVSEEDFAAMRADGCAYLIEGRIEDPEGDGMSNPPGGSPRTGVAAVRFQLCVPLEVAHGPCQAEDGLPGIVVTTGATTFDLTVHGDHLFFDSFPAGAEVVRRRAQWLADADLNGDGEVVRAELEAIDAAMLFRTPDYSLAGSPIPIRTAWDFVRAQLASQVHFQGEGECVIEVVE